MAAGGAAAWSIDGPSGGGPLLPLARERAKGSRSAARRLVLASPGSAAAWEALAASEGEAGRRPSALACAEVLTTART